MSPLSAMTAHAGMSVDCDEKLRDALEPPLPGSEQLRLQHSRAIEASVVLFSDWAFWQQSGRFDIGQNPSP